MLAILLCVALSIPFHSKSTLLRAALDACPEGPVGTENGWILHSGHAFERATIRTGLTAAKESYVAELGNTIRTC